MNKTLTEMLDYKKNLEVTNDSYELTVCPASCFLPVMYSKYYNLGSQNVSRYEVGAHTGEISAKMLKSIGVKYVLLNHYELQENKEVSKEKLKQCLKYGLRVVIFLSETEEEHYYQYTITKLKEQIEYYLEGISEDEYQNILFAYEPSWLIGKNHPLTIATIKNLFYIIKQEIQYLYHYDFPLLYGGGVTKDHIEALCHEKMIDGFVLGNTSLDVRNVLNILLSSKSDKVRQN